MTTQDILDELAAGLRGAKGAAEISNREAAGVLGVSEGTVSHRLRTAAADLPARHFIDLCRVYNADPEAVWSEAFGRARKVQA